MEVYLIRHGKTPGNLAGRYIGRTDEPLAPAGERALAERAYPAVGRVFVSPLLRCRRTAELLYPGVAATVCAALCESDFGDFENRSYAELRDNPAYRAWIDAGGAAAPPGGEAPAAFKARCCRAFDSALQGALEADISAAAFVLHGGVIMAVLEAFARPARPFYDWQTPNGGGWVARTEARLWREETVLLNLQKL